MPYLDFFINHHRPLGAEAHREVAFSPDGVYLAVTTGSGLVRLYVLPMENLWAGPVAA